MSNNKNSNLIGKKVILKPSYAKWLVDHPEVYHNYLGEVDEDYDNDIQIHLMCLIGLPVVGQVIRLGYLGCFGVEFKIAGLKTFYFVARKDVTICE